MGVLKMFLIFGGECYYANGGAKDLIETHEDKGCAIQVAVELIGQEAITYKANEEDLEWDEDRHCDIEWTQVFDTETHEIIYKSDNEPYGCEDGILGVK
jgi:hypothetical protein